jgi:hypothetical protein
LLLSFPYFFLLSLINLKSQFRLWSENPLQYCPNFSKKREKDEFVRTLLPNYDHSKFLFEKIILNKKNNQPNSAKRSKKEKWKLHFFAFYGTSRLQAPVQCWKPYSIVNKHKNRRKTAQQSTNVYINTALSRERWGIRNRNPEWIHIACCVLLSLLKNPLDLWYSFDLDLNFTMVS